MLHSFILYKHVYKTGTNRARIYWGTEKKKSQSKLKNRNEKINNSDDRIKLVFMSK